MEKVLYFGAGYDILPLINFKDTKEFVFIDTQPRAQYDYSSKFCYDYYNYNFYNELVAKYEAIGFKQASCFVLDNKYHKKLWNNTQKIYYSVFDIPKFINPHLCIFYNSITKQKIKYYLSCNVLFNLPGCFGIFPFLEISIQCGSATMSRNHSGSFFLFPHA